MYTNREIETFKSDFQLFLLNLITQDSFETNLIFNKDVFMALMMYSKKICPNSNIARIYNDINGKITFRIKNSSLIIERVFDYIVESPKTKLSINNNEGFIKIVDILAVDNSIVK